MFWVVGLVAIASYFSWVFYHKQSLDNEANRLSNLLNLQPGAVVAEIGAGNGDLTVRIAQHIGSSGKIYSTELNPQQLNAIQNNVKKHNLTNVQVIQGAVDRTNLPPECCDAIFMRGVYHHFTQPEHMNESLRRSLQPQGLLAIADFPPNWFSNFWKLEGVSANRGGHGIEKELLIEEVTQAGFEVVQVVDDWEGNLYNVLFRKPNSSLK
ncbi:methyltransferase domain-containing protein [Gloeocapsopsis dulcis]